MSAMLSAALPVYGGEQRVSQWGVVRSEWVKLRSLRSSVWCLLSAGVLLVVSSVLFATLKVDNGSGQAAGQVPFDATAQSLFGVYFAQVAVAVLGVLVFTGEFGSGMARVTFAAVPRRLPVLWGKVAALAVATFVVCAVGVLVAFFAGQGVLSSRHLGVSLGSPGVVGALVGAALFLTVTGVLGIGLGALVRNTAAGVSLVLGVLLVLPIVVDFLPQSLKDRVGEFLPGNAGVAVIFVRPQSFVLPPWVGLGVFSLYALLALALAAWQIKRRDV
jgi:ABC-type transport system involved in multi-copper enzyme maturation permease subunit